jgi:hemolysin III
LEVLQFREPVSAWTHGAWMLLGLPATLLLWRLSRGDRPKQLALLVFGISLMVCYAGSTLYHGVRLPVGQIALCETVDQIGIFVLIAGTYTPAAFTLLHGRWKWGSLALMWFVAVAGITLRSFFWGLPPWLYTGLYLAMGWAVVLAYFQLARVLSHRSMFPLVLGGVFYSAGALLNLARWPVLAPGVVGPHEILHLFVMAGTLTHVVFMVRRIALFDRRAADLTQTESDLLGTALEPSRAGG